MGKYLNGVTVWMESEERGPMEYSYENIDDACEGVRRLYHECPRRERRRPQDDQPERAGTGRRGRH